MSTLNAVPATPRKLLVNAVATDNKADAVWKDCSTAMHKVGITAEMCAPAYKATNEAFYNDVRAAIVEAFPADVTVLLNSPTKGLSDADKVTKRYWQQQIGSKQNRLVGYLKKLESAEDKGESEDKTAKTTAHKAAEYLLRAIRALEPKDGNLSGLPVGYKLSVHKEVLKKEYTALAGKPYKSTDA